MDALVLSPVWTPDPAKILNGQKLRRTAFEEILGVFDIGEVIETGTFLGDSTGFFAHMLPSVPVRSCELSPRFAALARARLRAFSNVEISCSDSRLFLSSLAERSPVEEGQVSFVYLDAHWHADLPLRDELTILRNKRPNSLIMIDDFQVPGDSGYGFDNYGRGKELTVRNFLALFEMNGVEVFFPSAPSSSETGYRRGCVVLAPIGPLSDRMTKVRTLKEFSNQRKSAG